jgi:hypothetical protein
VIEIARLYVCAHGLFWFVGESVDVIAMIFRFVPSFIGGRFGRSVKAVTVFVGEDHGVIVGFVRIVSRIKNILSMIFPSKRESSAAVIVPA